MKAETDSSDCTTYKDDVCYVSFAVTTIAFLFSSPSFDAKCTPSRKIVSYGFHGFSCEMLCAENNSENAGSFPAQKTDWIGRKENLMTTVFGSQEQPFVDRRSRSSDEYSGPNRRQFRDSYNSSNPDVTELANAVDQYKLLHRRRFITYEELHSVIQSLGYHK